jgi:7-carboxy-7-deazaguanine synthase
MHIEEILAKIETYPCKRICVTGGEPLAQALCLELLTTFCNQGYNVSLETSGAIDISLVDERVMIVMDIKTPASLEASKNLLSNLSFIKKTDQIKFVLCNEKDYLFAKDFLQEHALIEKTQVLFSPSYQELSPQALANWILRDGLEVRFQIQLHKILWGDAQGH